MSAFYVMYQPYAFQKNYRSSIWSSRKVKVHWADTKYN
jgi:hypothetical protein